MKVNLRLFGLFFVLAFALTALVSAGGQTLVPVTLSTVPVESSWEADGQTLYRVDVTLDSTGFSYGIKSVDWVLSLPQGLTLVSSQFPSQNFFYVGVPIDTSYSNPNLYNSSSGSITGRITAIFGSNYSMNRAGILATYLFVADIEAPLGEVALSFDVHSFSVHDPADTLCPGPGQFCSGYTEDVNNGLFTIVPPVQLQPPILRAVPASNTWVADGHTQYRIDVMADSTPQTDFNTMAVKYTPIMPTAPGFSFTHVSTYIPVQNDFFSGFTTTNLPLNFTRIVGGSNGPTNAQGKVYSMYFTVFRTNASITNGTAQMSFVNDISQTYFAIGSIENRTLPTIESTSFSVKRTSSGGDRKNPRIAFTDTIAAVYE